VKRSQTSQPMSIPKASMSDLRQSVEVIQDQMYGVRVTILYRQLAGDAGDSKVKRSGVANLKWRPAFGSTTHKALAVPRRLHLSRRPGLLGAEHRHAG
jgi:hypothetical protein